MIQVRMEIGNDGSRVLVRAGSLRRAVELAERRFPDQERRLVFPLDPDRFFVRRGVCEAVYVPLSEQVRA